MKRIVTVFIALALVLSFSVVSTAPVASSNGPPVDHGLVLHLDADAITGLTDDDPVSQWDDLSGQNSHATQGTAANQPTYKTGVLDGRPVVRFDGTGEHLLLPDFGIFGGDQDLTIMVVFKANTLPGEDDWENNEVLLNFRNENNIMLCFGDQGGGGDPKAITIRARFAVEGWANPVISHTLAEGTPYLIGVDYDTTSGWRLFRDGALEDTGDITETIEGGTDISAVGGASDGDNRWYDGDIAEILVYDRALTTQERVDMEWYLGEKWLGWERPAEVWVCDAHGDDGNPGTFDDPFKTIQHGVTVVAAGGTVHVCPGTYTEDVTITRSLTLRSTEGAGVTTITGLVTIDLDDGQTVVFGGEEEHGFTIDRGNPIPDSGILLSVDNGSEVTISHNIITGGDVGIRSEVAFTIAGGSTVVIEDNKIIGNDSHGIYMGWITHDSTVDILGNTIGGQDDDGNGGAGIYIGYIGHAPFTVTIAGNTITGNAGGGIYTGDVIDSTLIIEYNTITDNLGTGIHISSIGQALRTVTITHNTITGHLHHGGQDRDGIYVGHVFASTLNILGNVISDNRHGISLNDILFSTVDINFNNIFENDTSGVFVNHSDEPVDATHNWWGDASGPSGEGDGSGDAVSEDVNSTPWLGSAINPQAAGCTADRGYGEGAGAETDNVSARAEGGGTDTTVTVAEYVGNPTSVDPGFAAGEFFFDVHVGDAEPLPTELVVQINCPAGNCAGVELLWWDGEWLPVVAPTSVVNGRLQVVLSDTSTPSIEQLTGTPFALGNPPPTITPVGGTGYLVNRLALLAPWLALAAVIAGAAVFARRRQTQS